MNHQDIEFAPAAPCTIEHLPSHHCATVPEIDPRFAAAHYGHDLKSMDDIKSMLRIKTPNVWALMATAEKAAEYIALLESEADQLRMSWANAELDAARFVLFFEAIISDMHEIAMTPVQTRAAQAFKEKGCEPKIVDEIRSLIDSDMKDKSQ